jgi:aspartyl-tRNA(Asn)/glutamyl-tRNA(Gln) amidotransferase subunit A
MDVTAITVRGARALLQARTITALELAQAFLARIEAINPLLNIYVTVSVDEALRQARAADVRIAAGEDGPLLGIPIALKDVFSTQGVRTTAGSKILGDYVPQYDASVVERLRAMGAVFLGKVNCDEFAMGSSTENSAWGPTGNPWNPAHVPGGSSGGSAAAVAANLCCAALGTDTGGSIRQPASFCGVTGLKNSYGRVSRYGVVAYASSLDTVGALTKDAVDAEILLRALEGVDAHDSTTVEPTSVRSQAAPADLNGLRVGVPREFFVEGMQPEVEVAVREAIEQMRMLGATVQPVTLPNTALGLPVYYLIAPAEASANLARYDGVKYGPRVNGSDLLDTYERTRAAGFGSEVKRRIMLGTYALSAGYYDAYYIRAQKARTLIKRDFEQVFEQVDVLAAPVSPFTAFRIGERTNDPWQMYLADVLTLTVSLAGVPGISVPCGFDAAGLPIGLQLIGPAFGENIVLSAAQAYQAATGWHMRSPKL